MEIQQALKQPQKVHSHNDEDLVHPHSTRSQKMIGKYYLYKTVGSGSMGKVKLAMNTVTKEKVAVKMVSRKLPSNTIQPLTSADATSKRKKEKAALKSREIRTIKEASIMLLLNHPNIACLDELMVTEDYYYLCMEYIDGGQLLDYIISHGKLKEKQARQFARQIASALDYCHRNSIVHRDLKVENILISRKGTIKIIDFGLSNVFSPRSQLSTFCGSLYFAAPELLDGKSYTGPEVDVWSFGVVIYVLVCGQVPFDDPTMSGMHAKVKKGHVEYPSHLSADCKHLLQHLLVTNSKNRSTMSEVIVHPWMNKGYDKPIENHLPKRKPLQLPIDANVVDGMKGFEFGSAQQITEELEFLISSDEYQIAARNLETLSQYPFVSASSNLNIHPPTSIFKRKSFTYSMNDPQCIPAAYHPLISIYYLVKERMENKSNNTNHTTSSNTPSSPKPIKRIEYSYTADGKYEIHNTTVHDEDMIRRSMLPEEVSCDYSSRHSRKRSDTSSISPKETMFRRFSRRLSKQLDEYNFAAQTKVSPRKQKFEQVAPPIVIVDSSHTSTLNDDNRISPSIDTENSNSTKSDIKSGYKFNRFIKRATSITVKDLPSTQKNKSVDIQEKSRRKSVFYSANTIEKNSEYESSSFNGGFLAPPPPTLASNRDERNKKSLSISTTEKSRGQADESIRSVYLKGLFSVSNTSTKKASVIRKEIIRVLDKKSDIQYRETKDKFECYITKPTSHQLKNGHDFFEYSSDGEVWDNENIPNTVRFDIYIVKIPWLLNIRGIQFRRISGDPWHYRDTCSRILNGLSL